MCQEDRSVSHFARKQRDDRYDLNQLRTEPWIPNQDERRVMAQIAPKRGIWHQKSQKIWAGHTPGPLSAPAPTPCSTATRRARGRKLPRCWDLGIGNRSPKSKFTTTPLRTMLHVRCHNACKGCRVLNMIPCDLSAATSDTAAAAMLAGKNSRLLVQ